MASRLSGPCLKELVAADRVDALEPSQTAPLEPAQRRLGRRPILPRQEAVLWLQGGDGRPVDHVERHLEPDVDLPESGPVVGPTNGPVRDEVRDEVREHPPIGDIDGVAPPLTRGTLLSLGGCSV